MTTKTRRRESVLDNDPPPDDGARLEVTDDGSASGVAEVGVMVTGLGMAGGG